MRKMRLAARTRPGDLGDDVRHVLLVQLNLDAIQRLVGQLPDFLCERHDDRGREVLLRLRANDRGAGERIRDQEESACCQARIPGRPTPWSRR